MKPSVIPPIAVIDCNYGDSGKGIMTDYLADAHFEYLDGLGDDVPDDLPWILNCRISGGANAGHTVQRPDGLRHVFHHFGSGSFSGALTHLSNNFISNPMFFFKELEELRGKVSTDNVGSVTRHNIMGGDKIYLSRFGQFVTTDRDSLVTTPYDMMINQCSEEYRGQNRHGSCGMGINETQTRSENYFNLTAGMLGQTAELVLTLTKIRSEWLPQRLDALGVVPSTVWKERFANDDILLKYAKQCEEYYKFVAHENAPNQIKECYQNGWQIIFESSQGLLLDQNHRFFPHVTRANTGLQNVIEHCYATHKHVHDSVEKLDVVYCTRAYATRHGAGPFEHETPGVSYEDKTNVPNDWQGTLRFGHLDLDLMQESIKNDLRHAEGTGIKVAPVLAVTCLDQIGDKVTYFENGSSLKTETVEKFLQSVGKILPVKYQSYGPCREDVKRMF